MGINLNYLEDCNRARPSWMPEDGVASPFLEFLILLNTPMGYIWIAVLTLSLWKRSAFNGLLLILSSLAVLVHWTATYELDDDLNLGGLGGCVGSLWLAITVLLVVILFGVAVVIFRLFKW